jgi:hypothetical protein
MDGSIEDFESVCLYPAQAARGWPVAAAHKSGMHLRARCANPRCDRIVVFDASWWNAGNCSNERICMLEKRMRCISCGGREARFEVWSGPQPPIGLTSPGIYQFR